jgi:uncharacterized protein YprB with RNaseH-like and TPR domain
MPSNDLLKRLEALNGRPLENVPAPNTDGEKTDRPLRKRTAEPRGKPDDRKKSQARIAVLDGGQGVLAELAQAALADCLPGSVCSRDGRGDYYHVERHAYEHAPWCSNLAPRLDSVLQAPVLLTRAPRSVTLEPAQALFVDLETLGLSSEPLFLIGALACVDGAMVCRQYLARNLDEEATAIEAFAAMARRARLIVTFNGTTFDLPFLRRRAEAHGVRMRLPRAHVDVLKEARGRYRRSLPNCRLQTLEQHVCGRKRSGDVPSAEIPGVYRDFLRTGNASAMAVVVQHNLLDLATTAELFVRFREE